MAPGPELAAELEDEARALAGRAGAPGAGAVGTPTEPTDPTDPTHPTGPTDPAQTAELLDRLADRLAEFADPNDQPPQVRSLLAAVEALGRGDAEAAQNRLAEASDRSRAARDEVTYVVVTLTWSELLEQAGNRLGSYGVLARAMATLRRGVGVEQARDCLDALEQAMRDRRDRWGREAFAEVALEFRRRLTPPGTLADGAP